MTKILPDYTANQFKFSVFTIRPEREYRHISLIDKRRADALAGHACKCGLVGYGCAVHKTLTTSEGHVTERPDLFVVTVTPPEVPEVDLEAKEARDRAILLAELSKPVARPKTKKG